MKQKSNKSKLISHKDHKFHHYEGRGQCMHIHHSSSHQNAWPSGLYCTIQILLISCKVYFAGSLRTLKKNICVMCLQCVRKGISGWYFYLVNKKKIVLIHHAGHQLYCMHLTLISSSNAGTHWFQRSGEGEHAGGDSAINQHII